MRILILGAGQVGASVAEALVSEANDITLVDQDRESLALLADRLDVRTVCGNAAHPSVLREAGIDSTDLLVAVTQSDQTNLVACKIAHTLFRVPTRVARLRSGDFHAATLLGEENFAVDHAICPEQEITDYIARLVDHPAALQVLDFADGRVGLASLRVRAGEPLAGLRLSRLGRLLPPGAAARVAAVFRRHQPLAVGAETVIEAGDEVFLVTEGGRVGQVLDVLGPATGPVRRIMIAGAGNVGSRVAGRLEAAHALTVIEHNPERAGIAAARLGRATVLAGEATDETLLQRAGIAETDFFLALTNDDEDNIMAASLAKRLGCKRVLALINRRAYAEMVQGGPIDIGLSPAQVSIGSLLARVRRGDVARVHSLRRGGAEALELVVHGRPEDSRVVGRRIDQLPPIRGAHVGAIVRASGDGPGRVLLPRRDTVIAAGDHVIVFCTGREGVTQVGRLFQAGRRPG